MADSKITALTQNTAPLGSDLLAMVDDPAGTPVTQKIYLGDNNLLPNGFMINGKLSVTVAGGNITVALKTKSGGDPSATDPVSVWMNGSFRRVTAACSTTRNGGTSWCGAAATEFASLAMDYFVYLIWNTTPGTDIVDIGFARFPWGSVYSDFSTTTTNEKYLAFGNASTPTSTDDVVNIGRFEATNSGAAFSLPTFTNDNLKHVPVFETRVLTFVPTWTNLTVGNGSVTGLYQLVGRRMMYYVGLTFGGTTSISGTVSHSLPMLRNTSYGSLVVPLAPVRAFDADGSTAYQLIAQLLSTSLVSIVLQNASGTYVTSSGMSSTTPFTWATNDTIAEQGTYLA